MDAVARHFYSDTDEWFFFKGNEVVDYSFEGGIKFRGRVQDFFKEIPENFQSGLNAVSAHFNENPDELFFFKGGRLCDYSFEHGVKREVGICSFFDQLPSKFGEDLDAVTRHFYWPRVDELFFFKGGQLCDYSFEHGVKRQCAINEFFKHLPEAYHSNLDAVSAHFWQTADELFFFKNGRVCDYSFKDGVKFEGPIPEMFKHMPWEEPVIKGA